MDRQARVDLATADGHDRHVPSGSDDFLSAGHVGVYAWAVQRLVRQGTRLLDLGCGTGYGSPLVLEAGGTYDGVDGSPAAIDYARSNYSGPGVRFFVADLMETLPAELAPGSYDVVFSSEVLEHLTDPFAFVQTMAELVQDGGVAFVGTPNRLWSLGNMPGGGLLSRSHVMEFTPPALEALLRTAFEEVSLTFRVFPQEAIHSSVLPAARRRLVRGVLAFAREVAPAGVRRYGSGRDSRRASRAWSPADIDWLEPGDPALDMGRCVGLAAVCRGPRR